MVSIEVTETCKSTKTMLCAVAGNKTSVQKIAAWNMYKINCIKQSKAFFTHYACNRNNLYIQDTVSYIKKSSNYFINPHTHKT
jgi:hypothetical protein